MTAFDDLVTRIAALEDAVNGGSADLINTIAQAFQGDPTQFILPNSLTPDYIATNYLKLLTTTALSLSGGASTAVFPGAQAFSNAVTIAHNLGVIPQIVLGMPDLRVATSTSLAMDSAGAPTTTNIVLQMVANAVLGAQSIPFYWLAIG